MATFPGPYTLMYLPKETYDRDGHKLGLLRYPEFDHPTPDVDRPCDPYDPALLHQVAETGEKIVCRISRRARPR